MNIASNVCPSGARTAAESYWITRTRTWLIAIPPLGYLAIFYFIPLIIAIAISFWEVVEYRLHPAFTLNNYWEALAAPLNARILGRTLLLAAVVTAIAALIGFPVAYFLARRVKRFQQFLVILAILPLWTSYLIRSFAWIPILSRRGLINESLIGLGLIERPLDWLLYSQFSVVVVLVGVYIPYMILPCYAVLERMDGRLLEAATDLGASRFQLFWRIVLPLSAPGLAVGCLFVFVLAIGSYVTPALVGGTSGTLIGQQVTAQFLQLSNQPLGSAMALVIMGIVVVMASVVLRRFGTGDVYGR